MIVTVISIIVTVINSFIFVYFWMIMARCLLTWFPVNWDNPLLYALRSATDIYLDLFRKFIPPVGGFLDVSPVVAGFALIFILKGVNILAYAIIQGLGAVS